jgi:hypothetical protein
MIHCLASSICPARQQRRQRRSVAVWFASGGNYNNDDRLHPLDSGHERREHNRGESLSGTIKGVAVGVGRWPVEGLVACAARPCCVAAAVAGGRLGDRRAPRRGRGCDRSGIAPVGEVIHFPLVVCTSSPSTLKSLCAGALVGNRTGSRVLVAATWMGQRIPLTQFTA